MQMTCQASLTGGVCRRVDTSEAHAERAVLREQLDRAYDSLRLRRTEERDMVQDVAQVPCMLASKPKE